MGKIANAYGELIVSQAATVSNKGETVSLQSTETLINKKTDFTLSMELPLPLNRGCQIDLFIPKPFFIGSEFTSVTIGGLFGPIREAIFTIDATRNLIKIDGACLTYR